MYMMEESMNLKINAKYQCRMRKEKKMIGDKIVSTNISFNRQMDKQLYYIYKMECHSV